MKKLAFISLLAALVITSCCPPKFAVRGGFNGATFVGDDEATENLSTELRPHFGATAEFCLVNQFFFQPGIMFSQQGAKYEDSDGFDGRFKTDYLNLPLMVKYKVSDNFYFDAGPQIGFLLSAKDEYDSPISGEDDAKDFFKSTDFGANVGLGYVLDNGLGFYGRYNAGLSNINDISEESDIKIRNSVFSFGISFEF